MQSFYITNFNTVDNTINALKANKDKRESFLKAHEEGAPIFIDGKEATYAEVYAIKEAIENYEHSQIGPIQLSLTTKEHTKYSIDLIKRLVLDVEWAEGHEWDAPISLADDLWEAITYIDAHPN